VTHAALPGADLIQIGLQDLLDGVESVPALLVSIGAPRLQRLGIVVPPPFASPERRLYALLQQTEGDGTHARYNALIRRLVSYERAAECAKIADRGRIHPFMRALGAETNEDTRIYFSGGATAVLFGWRDSTIDVDIKIVPDRDHLLRAIPSIKENLRINVELASPLDFIPVPDGWEGRSPFIGQERRAFFHHFDLYAQALAKIERGHSQDLDDVQEMLRRGLIDRAKGLEYFAAVEPYLYCYPSLDHQALHAAVNDALGRS